MADVTITKERYDALVSASAHLNELLNRGVDNWDGYVGPGCASCPECGDDIDETEFGPNGVCLDCEHGEGGDQ